MKYRLHRTIIVSILAFLTTHIFAQEIIIPERWLFNPAKPINQEDTLTLRIFGDLMMHESQIIDAERPNGTYEFSTYFTHIQKYLDKSDLNIGNMEFTLAGKPYTGYPAFSAPDEYIRHITDCGFNVFLAANNHICDKRSAGMSRTLQIFRELAQTDSIAFTGLAGNQEELEQTTPLIIRRKGIRIAIINATYGLNIGSEKAWPRTNFLSNKKLLKEALTKGRQNADIVIVFPHWGDEYFLKHNTAQETEAKWLAENGADIIIGAHPHVIQDTGIITVRDTTAANGTKEVPVVYSLGNAISNMYRENAQLELMATVRLIKNTYGEIRQLPIEYTYIWSSRPGGYCKHYTMLPVKEQIGNSDEWKGKEEYEKMVTTYNRVKQVTKIKD